MCLRVDNTVKPRPVDRDGFCTGWKIVPTSRESLFGSGSYLTGYNFSNRKDIRHSCDTGTDDDKMFWKYPADRRIIGKGFHLFTNRKEAREFRQYLLTYGGYDNRDLIIVKAYYFPEDVVAYGRCSFHSLTFEEPAGLSEEAKKNQNMKNVVTMSMYIPSFKSN